MDSISYAASGDLLDWTDSGQVLAEHASVPGAVIKGATIFIYFVDVSTDGMPEQLGMLRSTDSGKTWSDKEILEVKGAGDRRIVDPAPLLLEDGRIRLYYLDLGGRRDPEDVHIDNNIYSAISDDGENFVQEEGVRFSHASIFDPDVLKTGDRWRMYVGNVDARTGLNNVLTAVSADGLAFTEEGIALEGGSVPDAFFKDGTFYLYAAGIDISTSADGASFRRTGRSFHSELGTVTADASVVEIPDGSYMMIFKFREQGYPPPPPPPGPNPPQ